MRGKHRCFVAAAGVLRGRGWLGNRRCGRALRTLLRCRRGQQLGGAPCAVGVYAHDAVSTSPRFGWLTSHAVPPLPQPWVTTPYSRVTTPRVQSDGAAAQAEV